jgi:hypothetical protein
MAVETAFRHSHSVSACALSFRAFGLVSVSFAFRFRACVLSKVEIVNVHVMHV